METPSFKTSTKYAAVLLNAALGAIHISLWTHALTRFCHLPSTQRRERRRYVFVSTFILLVSVALFILDIRERTMEPRKIIRRIKKQDTGWFVRESAMTWGCTAALALLGDAFLVWRATIIWSHKRMLKWVPSVVLAIYFGISATSWVFKMRTFKHKLSVFFEASYREELSPEQIYRIRLAQAAFQRWYIADFTVSVGVSVVTTTMICIRVLLMKRTIERLTGKGEGFQSSMPYSRVITPLLESALPFTLVGVAAAISTAISTAHSGRDKVASDVYLVMLVIWYNSLALGPQLIIFRILSGKTWTSNPTTMVVSQPIQFACSDEISSAGDDMEKGSRVTYKQA
ncbi:hypothetical protein BKA70DRAFT_1447337 [Coprinopsis sp. MPI-PUGE-AT-0042]|nr:hypothetical protein BKA70DRAFT_1447337 [Coprinopsis sp. MPI-PUGE-AT-0042]